MSHRNQSTANDRQSLRTLPSKASVTHPFSEGVEEEVTFTGKTTPSGLLEYKRPEAHREAILWFKPVDGKLVYVPF